MGEQIQRSGGRSSAIRPVSRSVTVGGRSFGSASESFETETFALPLTIVVIPDQILVNDSQTYGAMIEGLELVSRHVARYALVEELYLQGTSVETDHLADLITRVYTSILVYLVKARRYYDRGTGGVSQNGSSLSR
jgi:hypothetical protein